MKINNSKKQLAKIINDNVGWRDGYDFAAQDGDDYTVWFYDGRPVPGSGRWWKAYGRAHRGIEGVGKLPNWHQTILSRDEYFNLYPAPVKVVVENKTTCHLTVADKPTIEQLAADYRNAKDYADRKQQEADDAKVDAEAKLAELVAAGKAHGLVLSAAGAEHELVITDWHDLQAGDVISVSGKWWEPDSEYTVDKNDGSRDAPIRVGGYWALIGECSFKFIRRP